MKMLKGICFKVVLISLLLADVIYNYSGCGNIFIGVNMFYFIVCLLLILCVIADPKAKALDPIRISIGKVSIVFNFVVLGVLLYFGWWFNACVWAFCFSLTTVVREFLKQEKEKVAK